MNHIKCFLIIAFLFSFYPWAVDAEELQGSDLVFKLEEGVSLEDFLFSNNLNYDQVKVGRNGYVLLKNDDQKAGLMEARDWKKVENVASDGVATILTTRPNDSYYIDSEDMQWNLKKIGMETVWDDYKGTTDLVVAVIDTGLNFRHEDMSDLIWVNQDEVPNNDIDDDDNGFVDDYNGYNFISASGNIDDDNDHGTAVSSIIAANTNNSKGMAGVCWKARIMPVKVANAGGSASLFDIAQAIYYAVDNGAKVINLSLGAMIDQQDMRESVVYAEEKGVVLVAAAGNSESSGQSVNSLYYPANYPSVIAVGATDINDEIASLGNSSFMSHRGKNLDLVAPGVDILAATSGRDGDSYAKYDGTSMSVPQVVGAAVLLWEKNKKLSGDEIEAAILSSAEKVIDMTGDFDERYGHGRLDVLAALDSVKSYVPDDDSDDPIPDDEDDQTTPVDNNDDEDLDNDYYSADFGSNFTAKWVKQSNYWYLKPGEKRKVWIEFQNNGDALWQIEGNNAVHLGTDRSLDRSSGFYDQNSWLTSNRVKAVNKKSVRPGEIMRFEFEIVAPYQEGSYNEYFRLVAENKKWLNDLGAFWNFTVTNKEVYSSAWVDQSGYLTLKQDEKGSSWFDFVNNGTAVWYREGNNAVHLGTDRIRDRYSSFYDSGTWLGPNRILLKQVQVNPGEVGRFGFDVFPKNLGTFTEYFRPLVENKEWLSDQGVFLQYLVY